MGERVTYTAIASSPLSRPRASNERVDGTLAGSQPIPGGYVCNKGPRFIGSELVNFVAEAENRAVSAGEASRDAIDLLQQRIDGCPAPCRIRPGPSLSTEASARISFGLLSQIVHRLVDNRGTRTFSHGVPSAQNPCRPGVISLECCGRGERNQRVHERKLVAELLDECEAFTHHRDRFVRAPERRLGRHRTAFR